MIRPFGLRDVLKLRQLESRGVGFDLKRLLLFSQPPTRSALLGYLTHDHLGAITSLHTNAKGGSTQGFAQVHPRIDRSEWDLGYLCPALDHHRDAADLWLDLLRHVIVRGAQLKVDRVFARSAEDAEAEDILRQAGFSVNLREEVFALSTAAPPATRPKGLRLLEAPDRLALDRLCCAAEPRLPQGMQGFTLRSICPPPLLLTRAVSVTEHVWMVRDEALAYLSLMQSPSGFWLDVVVRPERRAELLPHLKYVLTLTECSPTRPVYCPVLDSGVGVGWLLRTVGFTAFARQVLLVAHTMVRARVRRPLMIPSLEGSMDVSAPAGPAYLSLPSEDR